MNRTTLEPGQLADEILSTLTPREAKVLRQRFGIDLEENVEQAKQKTHYIPPSGGNSGQGGAPQIAIVPAPSTQDKATSSTNDKAPKFRKTDAPNCSR